MPLARLSIKGAIASARLAVVIAKAPRGQRVVRWSSEAGELVSSPPMSPAKARVFCRDRRIFHALVALGIDQRAADAVASRANVGDATSWMRIVSREMERRDLTNGR